MRVLGLWRSWVGEVRPALAGWGEERPIWGVDGQEIGCMMCGSLATKGCWWRVKGPWIE